MSLHTWLLLLLLLLLVSERQGQQPGSGLYKDYFARGPQAQAVCGENTSYMVFCTTLYKVWANLISPALASKLLETSLIS